MAIIRVVIADPHDNIRASLASMIEGISDMATVGETANGNETIRLCETLKPDALLIGLSLHRQPCRDTSYL